jgi:uncharacterized cupin superfamily protein
MKNVSNINAIPEEFMDDPVFQSKMKSVFIGNAIGCEKFYVNMDYVKPGGISTKYHSHSSQEEFFLIISGSGILRMNGEELPIREGDVISKPAGKDNAHQFINNSAELLQILDVGTREADDICTYPDENVIYVRNKKSAYRSTDRLAGWTSDPNA